MEDLTNSLVLNVGDGITGISRGIEKANTLIVTCEKEGIKIYEVCNVLFIMIIYINEIGRSLIRNALRIGLLLHL